MIHLSIEDRVATVLLDRAPVNAWDDQQLDALEAVALELKEKSPALVVVRAVGRHFSAGADIKEIVSALDTGDFSRLDAFTRRIQNVFFEWEQLPMPTVAAMSGAVTGGGLELALACDLRIATKSARIGCPEVLIGLLPAGGGTQRLTRLVGRGRALRLILTGELISGADAHTLGIVEWVAEDEHLDELVDSVVKSLLEGAGPALAAIKRSVGRFGTADGYAGEVLEQRTLHKSDEARDRLRAFVTKRTTK